MKTSARGFTLLEMAVVMATAAVLMMLLATAASNSRPNVRVVQCLAHHRQLYAGWIMYSQDYSDRVPNNFGIPDTQSEIAARTFRTWACDVMEWTAAWGVTNTLLLQSSLLGPYINRDATLYRCPSDNYLSPGQRAAGWTARARSVSMNGFFGPDNPSGSCQSGRSDWAGFHHRKCLLQSDRRLRVCPLPGLCDLVFQIS